MEKIKFKRMLILPCMILVLFFVGCNIDEDENISFNMRNSVSFVQNENYYFVSENFDNKIILYAVSKIDEERFPVIHTPFNEKINPAAKCIANGNMYFMQSDGTKGFTITEVSLTDFSMKKIAGQSGANGYSFLGLEYSDSIVFDKYVLNFFTDGKKLFLITSDYEVYSCGLNLKNAQCIISDGIFAANLCFDGKNIYYINNMLELKSYNPYNNESKNIADGFVTAFDINNDNIVYSNKNGIFVTNNNQTDSIKLSEKKTASLSYDGENIVFSSDNKLYHIRNNTEKEIYSGSLVYFSCIDKFNKVICSKYDNNIKNYVEFILDL